ncbi:MAG: 16S rRNA (uracil(1498)-N(3))-methyltransferase [Phycisphaeraceae bacterium]|nr:16S rRNA (uracil(1498)-N(3))-methyltransferase [Phycisphaerales bacterium]MCB9860512.1 16S rRNA (uracil(1498)-N(3))-methyltransferase [Phycisphaeraceae bacterium]
MHSILLPTFPHEPGAVVRIEGDEAKHAVRSKRLEVGHVVQLLDGAGTIAQCVIHEIIKDKKLGWIVDVKIEHIAQHERLTPKLHVIAAGAKGDRLEHMIDGLSQVGVASWHSLVSIRTVVEPREGKLDRLRRVAEESCKQSGRPWLMDIGDLLAFEDVADTFPDAHIVIADASGTCYADIAPPNTSHPIVLLIGPEGGWDERELQYAREQNWAVVSFGHHIMRIETAAVAASAIILDHHRL